MEIRSDSTGGVQNSRVTLVQQSLNLRIQHSHSSILPFILKELDIVYNVDVRE